MKKENHRFVLYSLFLAFVFLAVCSKSSFLYPFNDWYDANDFLTLGRGMLHGLVPYRDLYEQKGVILYAVHALCALVPGPAFLGVWFLEVAALTLFLFFMFRLIRLYLPSRMAYGILPVLCTLILSAESFCQGDSAEELCSALLAITFFHTLEHFRNHPSESVPLPILLTDGILAGIILWVKYTLLGFHLAYMAMLFFFCIKDRKFWCGIKSCLVFLLGMAVPSVPVLIYFAANNAIGDLFQVYFYNNIFLYDSQKAFRLSTFILTILARTADTFIRNLQFSAFTIIGVTAFLLSRSFFPTIRGKLVLTAEALFLPMFVYTGSNFPYYGYILCIFPVLGLIVITKAAEPALAHFLTRNRKTVAESAKDAFRAPSRNRFLFGLFLLLSSTLLFAGFRSPNTADLGKKRSELVQYRFASIMRESESPTLLNYGFLDAGFYTAADILPTEKYFQMQNISYDSFPEMMDFQNSCIREQRVEYVVVRGEEVPAEILSYYSPVASMRQTYEGAHVLYTLLQKKS